MMDVRRVLRQPPRRLLPYLVCVGLLALPASRAAGAAAAQASAPVLMLSNAPVSLEYPETWRKWAVRLAAYADSAARDIQQLLGVALPAGTIRWEPSASGPGAGADGIVQVQRARGGGALVVLHTNVPLLLQDYGAGFALGYARWLGAYAMARVAMGAPGGNAPWWTEGAALYLTDRLFRDSHTTTPILYGLQANFTRAAQSRRPVDLAATTLDAAGRGKAYATFKLLEGLYGADAVATAIGHLVQHPSTELAAIADALGRERRPDPDQILRDWLQPAVAIDIGIDKVQVRDNGKTIRLRLQRQTPIPLPVRIVVRTASGDEVTENVPAGVDDQRIEMKLPGKPVAVIADPDNLLPDTNRSNNRHGFGNAANVRRFFKFDQRFTVGELQFSGDIQLDDAQQRQEQFHLLVTNRTDRATGLGFLVSAAWLSRPERKQRAYFVQLGPGETRLLEEAFAYPNRGTGRAQIEARYWEAASPQDLTDKLLSAEPGLVNDYLVVRDAPPAPRRAHRGIYRLPPRITETTGVVQSSSSLDPATKPARPASNPDGTVAPPRPAPAVSGGALSVQIVSPTPGSLPIGDVVLAAEVGGDQPPEQVDFYVNDRPVGTVQDAPYRLAWTFPDEEQVFVIRAVAVAGSHVAADDVILDKAAVAFGSTVNLVTIHATVRDAQGRLVRNLTADDFRVIEDGQQQKIEQFDFGEVPVAVALLLDQSSSMIGAGIRAERAGAKRLVDSLVSDVNRVMILGFTDHVYLYTDFTGDRRRLEAALQTIDPDGPTALFDTLAEAIRKVNRRRGKRALVVLSDGLDTNSQFAYEDVVEYLRQTDVLVYTIGLQLMQEGTALGDASGAVKKGVQKLRALAEATGGAAYFPLALEELEEIYALIADELNSQYALSYYPSNRQFDGSWRQLRVDIPGHAGYWVQVRPGYYGVSPETR